MWSFLTVITLKGDIQSIFIFFYLKVHKSLLATLLCSVLLSRLFTFVSCLYTWQWNIFISPIKPSESNIHSQTSSNIIGYHYLFIKIEHYCVVHYYPGYLHSYHVVRDNYYFFVIWCEVFLTVITLKGDIQSIFRFFNLKVHKSLLVYQNWTLLCSVLLSRLFTFVSCCTWQWIFFY